MISNRKGFTMIELVMVIVILGILAAIAVPRFVDLRSDAERATAKGVGGAISSAANMLHAQYILRNTVYTLGTYTSGNTLEVLQAANISGGVAAVAGSPALQVVTGGSSNVNLTVNNNLYTMTITLNSVIGPSVRFNNF